MAIGWFVAPYKRLRDTSRIARYCAMNDFTLVIRAEKGDWTESEVLGNVALVKVRASEITLTKIAGTTDFLRISNHSMLTDSLNDLTTVQDNAIKNKIIALGYTASELQAALGSNLKQKTLGDVLRFMATRRREPRYDKATDAIVMDGDVRECRSIESVDAEITEITGIK